MRIWLVIVVMVLVATARGQGIPGGRAPADGAGAVSGANSLGVDNPAWGAAAVAGTSMSRGALVIPDSLPGDPLQLGVNAIPPHGPIRAGTAGLKSIEGGISVWRVRVDAPGADAVRLKISGLDLGVGESVVVSGHGGRGYVVTGRGSAGDGVEWTPVLEGSSGYVECHGPQPRISIDEVSQIKWPAGGVRDLLPCHVDVQCETADPLARDSVGMMVYTTPLGTFSCTGTLLNDTDPGTTLGWFLTSNKCINTQNAASSLTVYWFFQSDSCNGPAPSLPALPVSQGAQLLVNTGASDTSFLKLNQNPTQGQGLAGWTGDEPAGAVATIHHPLGFHKRIARGNPTMAGPICFGTMGIYQFHYVSYALGTTEAGSTGAPLFNSNWQVVGQLTGTCSMATPTCENPTQWKPVFGRLNRGLPLIKGFLTGQVSPDRVYVNAAATGAGTGLSWADAYTSLSTALAGTVPPPGGMEVWVAAGMYTPAATAGRESAFVLTSGVSVYGGFSGNETQLSQRNVAGNATVLSGDLAGDDGPNFANRGDNVYHVMRGTGVNSTAVLDGFTIRGGNANGPTSFNDKGGGIYVEGGGPRLKRCTFEEGLAEYGGGGFGGYLGTMDLNECAFNNNRAEFGGAISLTTTSGVADTCDFSHNTSTLDGGAVDLFESAPTLRECEFLQNVSGRSGGAISAFIGSGLLIDECRFDRNSSAYAGGAVSMKSISGTMNACTVVNNTTQHFGGGVLTVGGASLTMTASRFLGNVSGEQGGAVHANSGTFRASNSEFSGNRSNTSGGAIWHNKGCQTTLLNCTLAGNTAVSLAGGAGFESGTGVVTNCIFWGNTDSTGTGEGAQVRLSAGATASVSYSLLQGLTGSLGGAGNIGANPLFELPAGIDGTVGTEDDNLAPGDGSPARDAGDTPGSMTLAMDVRGNSRHIDDTCVLDTGIGPAPMVDMGAIEGASCGCYANCDGSAGAPLLTANDFTCFVNAYAGNLPFANCDGSTGQPLLTGNDFTCFINAFALGCP